MIPWLGPSDPFPPLRQALAEPSGLLAAGGDLSPQRLVGAYSRGIFPWYAAGEPILWWSPDPRMVLFPEELKVSRSLRKTLRKGHFKVSFDKAFTEVMRGCAAPRRGQPGTWIHSEIIAAYQRLHELGYAHSVEVWKDDQIVGGLYGIALGRAFFGESMFSRVSDASKVGFAHLVVQLQRWGFEMIDCQMNTSHLASLGAREISRAEFSERLQRLTASPTTTRSWSFEADIRAAWETQPGEDGS